MQYDIFISYKRRGTSSATAAYIYDLLTKKGYSVFFDRKEIRQGSFDTQLLTHIENAKDIFVLLEESSLDACFKEVDKESYKTDWFCMEIMHALKKNKRIIPLLLDGYKMPDLKDLPDELKALSKQNAIQLDVSEINDFYQKYLIDQQYLESKPRNIFLAEQTGDGVANFLFYCDEDCDIYEFGRLIGRIDQNIDEEHPYIFPVKYAGEHRFKLINNDTCEEQKISITIEKDKQLYVPLTWKFSQNLWELTDEIIEKQKDGQTLYLWGKGLFEGSSKHESDYEWSFRCLKRAAKMWCLDAKKFIINNCETVFGNPKAASIELPWLELAAEYECASAYFFLGKKYHYGIGVEKNIDKSVAYYEKAVKQDEPRACNNLAFFYFYGEEGVKQNVTRGLELYHKSAEMGRPIAMYNLGKIYCLGENGIEIDKRKGLKYYEMAAESGNINLINELGTVFFYGVNGVDADKNKGLEFFEKAAEAGNTDAINNLGGIYFYGENNTTVDKKKGLDYYEKAANAGDCYAMANLGYIYYYGRNGINIDTNRGLEFFKKAAEAGNIMANAQLSLLYKKNKSGLKDLSQSEEYAQNATKFIEMATDKYHECNQIAWTFCEMREYKEALIWAQKLIEANTTDTNHLDTIACAYKGLKRYDDALKYYQKALDLGRTEAAQDIEEVKKLIANSKKTKRKSTPKKKASL